MTQISVMALPGRVDDDDAPVLFYLLRHGSWHEVPLTTRAPVLLSDIRKAVERLLTAVMQRIGQGDPAAALLVLRAKSQEWWDALVPGDVRQAITDGLADAAARNVVPELLIHTHGKLEWLPWELLHDGGDWLGLRFRISRLPIVVNGGVPPVGPRKVCHARSFLGTRVFGDAEHEAYEAWACTFDPFNVLGLESQRWPANGLGGGGWPGLQEVVAAREADIIHVTAHGGVDSDGRQYLTLNPDDDDFYGIDESIVAKELVFATPGPLVFGNACGSLAAGQGPRVTRGLGVSFFDRGAAAYIGTMAPIGKDMAIRFAANFYRHLLQDREPVGEALRLAKRDQRDLDQDDPSWLFYCLYGLPGTLFVPDPLAGGTG